MQTSDPQTLFAAADELLATAQAEFNRAEEDAVTHLICHNSRQSIVNYLLGFLMSREAHLPYPLTLEGLLEKCQAIDPRFQQIDSSNIQCRFDTEDKEYCLDHNTVDGCFRIARQMQAIVKS